MIVRLLVSINTVYFVVIDTLHIVLYSCYHLSIVISVVINIAKYIANTPYATVLGWIRCRLSFCLLCSAIQCIRGARSSQGRYIKSAPVALVQSETQFLI